jgi:hypothetical protein
MLNTSILQKITLDQFAFLTSVSIPIKKLKQRFNNGKKLDQIFKGKNETELRNILTKNCDALSAIDTHNTSNTVEFMPPRTFGNEVVFSKTARADLTSTKRRLVFEVKSENCEHELLLQIVQRVIVSMDMCHLLANSIAFGATPENAFVCIGVRAIPKCRAATNTKEIYIYKVGRLEVCAMWQIASTIDSTDAYLTEDAPLVIHSLQSMGINPWVCRIHLSWWSQNRVYQITLPENYDFPQHLEQSSNDELVPPRNSTCLGVNSQNPTFAMKVVQSTDEFTTELECLTKVKPIFFICGFGVEDKQNNINKNKVLFQKSFQRIDCQLDSTGWWNNDIHRSSSGGVIFMKIGEELSRDTLTIEDSKRIFNDCLQSLRILHSKGFYHTDVRLANIIRLKDTYELIDFGAAIKVGATVDTTEFSTDRRNLVTPLQNEEKWSALHDVQLLTNSLFNNLITNSLSSIESSI